MFRRPGAALLALAFFALVFVPLAGADHAYSHRYIVLGRVVDAENNPVPGIRADLGYEPPFEPEGPCANQPETDTDAWGVTRTTPVTNQFGEFIFCFHTHRISSTLPGTGILRLEDQKVEQRFEFDPYFRHSFILVKLDTVHPSANKETASTQYTIQGTVWQPPAGRDTFVDGIKVFGITFDQYPVNVTFEYNGKPAATYNTTTNNYGDFAIRVPVTERPTSGKVTIVVDNETFTQDVDPNAGTTVFFARMPKPDNPFVRNFLIGLGVVVVVGGGGTALWLGTRKMREAREASQLAELKQRRRANK